MSGSSLIADVNSSVRFDERPVPWSGYRIKEPERTPMRSEMAVRTPKGRQP